MYDGKGLGQLQPVEAWENYTVAVRCKMHNNCSRTRSWRGEGAELHCRVDRVLTKWLIDGIDLADADAHKKLLRE